VSSKSQSLQNHADPRYSTCDVIVCSAHLFTRWSMVHF